MTASPTCLNLSELFGDRFRIGHDPVAETWKEKQDPWMMTILCQRGLIYPYGGTTLAVEIDYRPILAKAVAKVPGVRLYQDGDWEKTFLFDVSLFDQIAAIVKPRKRKQLSEEQRERLADIGKQHRFSPRSTGDQSRL
jgi:hypothetical protein